MWPSDKLTTCEVCNPALAPRLQLQVPGDPLPPRVQEIDSGDRMWMAASAVAGRHRVDIRSPGHTTESC